jgi:hypothetical protein
MTAMAKVMDETVLAQYGHQSRAGEGKCTAVIAGLQLIYLRPQHQYTQKADSSQLKPELELMEKNLMCCC